jgi:hypothetical protein
VLITPRPRAARQTVAPVAASVGSHRLVMGQATVRDGPRIDGMAPSMVRLRQGQSLQVVFRYDLAEASRQRERYQFTLRSKLGIQFGDRWGWPQSVVGFLEQNYVLEKPGQFELHVTLVAAYGTRPWLGLVNTMDEVAKVDQRVRVVVDPW